MKYLTKSKSKIINFDLNEPFTDGLIKTYIC